MARKGTKSKSKPRGNSTQTKTAAEVREELMDGAKFLSPQSTKLPDDYMPGENGMRPDETKLPNGHTKTRLDGSMGTGGAVLPPRSVWAKGKWLTQDAEVENEDEWRTWVVPGYGTPGNFQFRIYVLPEKQAALTEPDHPADWPEELKRGKSPAPVQQQGYKGYQGTGFSSAPKTPVKASSSLPRGVVARCVGCGHFFEIDDLADHAKTFVCPSKQGEVVLFAMPCECHPGDVVAWATVLPGFPAKPTEITKEEDKKDE